MSSYASAQLSSDKAALTMKKMTDDVMEQMIEAGINEGLSAEIANELVVETALGAAKMAKMGIDNPKILRKNVTSPGGTTEAALNVFYQKGFVEAVTEAVRSAKLRSKELSED